MGRKKTTEQFRQEVYSLVGDGYELTGEYVKAKTKVSFTHKECGESFDMTPDNFKNGQRCSHCFGKKFKGIEKFKEDVFNLVGNEYEVVGKYVNTNTNISIVHNDCGETFKVLPKNFIHRGDRCSNKQCRYKRMAEKLSITTEEYKNRVYEQVGDEYTIIGEYTNTGNPVDMIHNICGQKIQMSPVNFFYAKKRCIYCSGSKGEKSISEWLKLNSINYTREYRFADCKNKRALPFDFAVFDDIGNIITLIEFHGIHHYESVKGWGGRGKLERALLTDSIKREYCHNNNINLLVIPYWDFDNINTILEKRLTSEKQSTQSCKLE